MRLSGHPCVHIQNAVFPLAPSTGTLHGRGLDPENPVYLRARILTEVFNTTVVRTGGTPLFLHLSICVFFLRSFVCAGFVGTCAASVCVLLANLDAWIRAAGGRIG